MLSFHEFSSAQQIHSLIKMKSTNVLASQLPAFIGEFSNTKDCMFTQLKLIKARLYSFISIWQTCHMKNILNTLLYTDSILKT